MPGPVSRDGWSYHGLEVSYGDDQRVSGIGVDARNLWLVSSGPREKHEGKLVTTKDGVELSVEYSGNYVVQAQMKRVSK